jgi:alanine racemase
VTLRLSVQREHWERGVRSFASAAPALVPVVKGNGYGFGRSTLFDAVQRLVPAASYVCVGTIHEAVDAPESLTPVVLTPVVGSPRALSGLPDRTVLTVGAISDLAALRAADRSSPVIIKLRSSMRRYGVAPDQLDALVQACDDRPIVGFGLHLPLAGTDAQRCDEVDEWLRVLANHSRSGRTDLNAATPLWLSHLSPTTFDVLARRAQRPLALRVGTALWHGDKSALHLSAEVLAAHDVRVGERVGYHASAVPVDGTLVCVGGGSAHGIAPLPGVNGGPERSPFHFAQRRLRLVDAPHMHTSLVVVPAGEPTPNVGDWVDVQRPLITTNVDEVVWQ